MPENDNKKIGHQWRNSPTSVAPSAVEYAELDVTTNYSFLRGASHPDELVYTAAELGCMAMAVTDVNTVAGVVRAYEAAKQIDGFKLIVGCRLVFVDGTPDLLVWPTDRRAYGRLCQLLTVGKKRAPKGECHLSLQDFLDHSHDMLAAACLASHARQSRQTKSSLQLADHAPGMLAIQTLHDALGDRLSLTATAMYDGDDESRLRRLMAISRDTRIPLVATNHVHYHAADRRMLQDVVTCIRHGCTLVEAGRRLFPNGERYLKTPEQMGRLFRECPQAIERAVAIAKECRFDLGTLGYRYPDEVTPPGVSSADHLRNLVYEGGRHRYGGEIPVEVCKAIEYELSFISDSRYESYFLTVHDLVRFANEAGILCQGRGSAANSAVCYCLGVTAVDPAKFQLVFERFASPDRNEPPDIDIDFQHERREEVIQFVYDKYGRDRAAMTASVITYRGRSAVRDVGKALGFSTDTIDHLAEKLDWWHRGTVTESHLTEMGINPFDPSIRLLVKLSTQLLGFPRHLSQHVGGMVIARDRLDRCVPVENAAMENRTVIEWDKDDIHTLCMFKVDLLGLGMLTCLSKSMKMINELRIADCGLRDEFNPQSTIRNPQLLQLHTIPHEDPEVYRMASDADTIGVFQIESRAQMSMLPRLRPEEFYDLVIEVAIVRPGPIQGKMVHPYLTRREKLKADRSYRGEYPPGKEKELSGVLGKTLGVPLFQEQAMRLAEVAAKFTRAEADALRRSMAAWKRSGGINRFHAKFVNGMIGNGYEQEFAENCFKQISGFGEYGFPESHAASFAKLVYASAWLKRRHPAAFAAGLLNSQPMGFYAPAQIIRDAKEHGVEVRPVDVNASKWDCTLEVDGISRASIAGHGLEARATEERPHKGTWGVGGPAVRLGFREIKGMSVAHGDVIAEERQKGGVFTSIEQFQVRTKLPTSVIRRLAEADAFSSLKLSRRMSTWETLRLRDERAPLVAEAGAALRSARGVEQAPYLPFMSQQQEVMTDYHMLGLSLKQHPVAFARKELTAKKIITAATLADEKRCPHGRWVKVAGLVLVRQRPGTAKNIVFMTLEDETGVANLIVWPSVYERFRPAARHATLLQADGYVQRQGQIIHVLAKRLFDLSDLVQGLRQPSRDFH